MISLIAVVVFVVLVAESFGWGRALRSSAASVFPLACIWFADDLVNLRSPSGNGWSGGLDAKFRSPAAIRWGGWFGLTSFAGAILLRLWR